MSLSSAPRPVLVFDVNETLLDLSALDPVFAEVFEVAGGTAVRQAWFKELLHEALVATVTGPYVDFSTLARSALRVTAKRHGHRLDDQGVSRIFDAVTHLPPHDDVADALDRLDDAGFRLVALSNGAPEALAAQLDHAGLTERFEMIASAESAGRLKPAAEPYRWVARTLDVSPDRLCMVAAHAWDTTGALRAGLQAAFVERPGKVLSDADPAPHVTGSTLDEVARTLVDSYLS